MRYSERNQLSLTRLIGFLAGCSSLIVLATYAMLVLILLHPSIGQSEVDEAHRVPPSGLLEALVSVSPVLFLGIGLVGFAWWAFRK